MGKRQPLRRLEDVGIPEEIRDVDQQVREQRLRFLRFLLQQTQILAQILRPSQDHPAVEPPQDRRLLVLTEIHPRLAAQQQHQPVKGRVVAGRLHLRDFQMPGPARQGAEFLAHLCRRHYEIHHAGGYRAPRHAVELGRLVLRKGDPAFGFDRLQP